MSKIKCCMDCKERKLFCHSTCEKYIEAKALNDARALYLREQRNKENIYVSYLVNRISKK